MKKIIIISILVLFIYIAPAANSAILPPGETTEEYMELKSKLEQLIQDEKGTYGVCVVDIGSGEGLGLNQWETFHAASTFKLPLNLYLYEQIAAGKVNSYTKLIYRQEHYEGGTGRLQYEPFESTFSINQLSKYSIVYSDNVATNMLLSYLGRPKVKNYMRSIGGVTVSDDKNVTCPWDMALYMAKILDFTSRHPKLGNELMGNLQNTIFNNRIPKLLPGNIKIAHKIGNWPPTGSYHDVGYVQHPEKPYIIAILSKDTPCIDRAFEVIQRISRIVYDYQSKLAAINLLFNGRPLKTGSPPVVENGRVLVPVRVIAEAMNAGVRWDDLNDTVTILKPGKDIFLRLGSRSAIINGVEMTLTAPPQIVEGRTMVPLRFIGEALDAVVNWESTTKTVSVKYNKDTPGRL